MTASESTTVGEDFPKQQARVRRVLGYYREVGAPGRFGVLMIEATLREAEEAQASGDILRILAAYAALVDVK